MTVSILDVEDLDRLRATAASVAVNLANNPEAREVGGSNLGPFVLDTLRGRPYLTRDGGPAWCALLVNYCYMEACRQLYGHTWRDVMPYDPWRRQDVVVEAGAQTTVNRIIVGGRKVGLADAKPGDVFLSRRPGGYHTGVIALRDGYRVETIEGNVGVYPARVKLFSHRLPWRELVVIGSIVPVSAG